MQVIYSLWLYGRTFLFLIFFFPLILPIGLFSSTLLYQYARFLSKSIFWLFNIKINIKGHFPNDGPYILMHNHTSFLDLFCMPTIIKGPYTGIVAQKNFSIPLIGSILKRLNAIPINRSNSKSAKESISIAENFLKKGLHIAIFPEGTRTITGQLSPFKKGGFHMAINTRTNILPIIVKGLYNIKPKTRWTIKPGIMEIIITPPITVKNKTVDELLDEVQSIYLKADLL
tara:strand:- start:440 stop:1126 length:687 start_codon:yes stop_codon:yes gene_type:complete